MSSEDGPTRITATGWQSAIEMRQLRAFLAVVEHGSLSAAALSLGLAQSTISEALSALDRAVGMPTVLRKRGAHAVVLTQAGEALLPYARRMMQDLDGLHVAVAQVTRGAQATVQVMANESVSTYLLPPILHALRKRWPKVSVSVGVGTCATVRSAVALGQCDLGLLLESRLDSATAEPGPAGFGAASVVTLSPDVPLVVFASPGHPLVRRGGPLRRDMLQPFSLLIADSAGDFHQLVRKYFAADGLPGPQLNSVGSIEAVKRGVEGDTTALGLLPHYALAEDIARHRVYPVTLAPSPPRMQLVAISSGASNASHPIVGELLEDMRSG
jgi:DNA-binding transcriptional LysR family regulator